MVNKMEVHPLLMPEVLTNVFQYLSVKDLFACRLVSTVWNSEASTLVGSIIKTTLSDETHFTNILTFTKSHPDHPYRTFELQDVRISLDNPDIEEFFTVCGPYIHHLTVWYNRDADDGTISIRTFRDILLYYLPNLKSLALQHLPHSIFSKLYLFPPVGFPEYFKSPLPFLKNLTIFSDLNLQQSFLEDLLSLSCSVESITVKYGVQPGDFKQRLINAMLNRKNNLKNLKSFKYFMHDLGPGSGWSWSPEECETIAKSGWSLQTLKLNPARSDTDNGFMYLMERLKSCLNRLTVRVHHPLRFPVLHCLGNLTLYDYEENLAFLENLPNLRYLGLCEYFPSKTITSENIMKKSCTSLTSLNLYGSTISDHLFKKMMMCLPNLRNLNLWHCTKKKFRSVVKHAKYLQELVINVSNMDDEAITGMPSSVCEQIERRLKNHSSLSDLEDELRHRSKVFIGDMKNLQRLEIHGACLADWRWSSIGDVSVIYGISCIPNLTSLLLKEFKWITEESIKTIIKSTPLQQLKIDPREFDESLESQIRSIKPSIRLEFVTDDYEIYLPRGMHSVTDSFVSFAHDSNVFSATSVVGVDQPAMLQQLPPFN